MTVEQAWRLGGNIQLSPFQIGFVPRLLSEVLSKRTIFDKLQETGFKVRTNPETVCSVM